MNRILWNPGRKTIDEIVLHNPEMVHIEQMDSRIWWIGIYMPDGTSFTGNFHPKAFTEQDSDIEWEEDKEHTR